MDGKPRLLELSQCPVPGTRPNVLVVSGLPWHVSEFQVHQYLLAAFPAADPVTTRLYDDPVNGVSRGHCFVEYRSGGGGPSPMATAAVDLEAVRTAVEAAPLERVRLTAAALFLTATRWDRGGRLPDLPTDPPPLRRGQQVGYGGDGFTVRCGPALGLANTATPVGAAKLRALRKRLRAAAAREQSSSSSSSGSGSEDNANDDGDDDDDGGNGNGGDGGEKVE